MYQYKIYFFLTDLMLQSPAYRKHPKEYVCEICSVHLVGSRYIKDLEIYKCHVFNPWCTTEENCKVIPIPNYAETP
jgi:hypothetical protein